MKSVIDDTRKAARGHEAVLVSHQLPIWIIRLAAENRRLWHDPRRRQCALASLTSFTFDGERLVSVGYSEPAGALLKGADPPPGA
jgi:broad specificity phosphatase PhoE